MPNNTTSFEEYLSAWSNLPSIAEKILTTMFNFLVYVAMFIGGIMVIWGAIEWATGYNETGGRRNIIRGVILLILSLAPLLISSL